MDSVNRNTAPPLFPCSAQSWPPSASMIVREIDRLIPMRFRSEKGIDNLLEFAAGASDR
jgi:hypothetical protein